MALKTYFHVLLMVVVTTMVYGCASSSDQGTLAGKDVVVPFEKISNPDRYSYEGQITTPKEQVKLDTWLQNYSRKFYQNNPDIDLYEGEGDFEVTTEMVLPVENRSVTFTVKYDYLLRYKEGTWNYSFTNIILNQTKNGTISNPLEEFVEQYAVQEVLNVSTSNYLTSLYGMIDSEFKERINKLQ